MPRERVSYRDNLERLNEAFPEQELLCIREAAKFLGIDDRTAKKYFSFRENHISKAVLARELS